SSAPLTDDGAEPVASSTGEACRQPRSPLTRCPAATPATPSASPTSASWPGGCARRSRRNGRRLHRRPWPAKCTRTRRGSVMITACLYIDTPNPEFLTLGDGYEAGFLDAEILKHYAARSEYDLPERFVSRELEKNSECFGIRAGGTLAAYGWYATGSNLF